MRLYTFFREEGFYPLEIDTDSDKVALDSVPLNPGTRKVIRHYPWPETVIFDAMENRNQTNRSRK